MSMKKSIPLKSLRQPLQDVIRILRVARRPDRREFTLMLKICSLGLAILGVYSFIVLYLAFIFLFR
ncbi:MAG: preprotein translocase subunit SecE [Candidatus Nezhaarchaeales archaeon]